MATKPSTTEYILDQTSRSGTMTVKKMFGEYALYCGAKVVGLICYDQLFIKPSPASPNFEDRCSWAPAYPGSKDYLLVPEEEWEYRERLEKCIRETADSLPAPIPKKPKIKRQA